MSESDKSYLKADHTLGRQPTKSIYQETFHPFTKSKTDLNTKIGLLFYSFVVSSAQCAIRLTQNATLIHTKTRLNYL